MKTIQVSIILILFCILSAQDSIYVNFKLPYLQLQPTLFGGDLNGDGFDDMVFVGMRKIDQYHLGVLETMIFFGETYIDSFPDIAYINTPEIPSYKICYNGDLNGDGINDMVLSDIGYPDWYNYGMLWIILGKSDFQMEPDYIMYGIDYFHGDYPYDSYFGIDIDCSGDFNGDGFDDLYVYAPGTSPEDYGYFWVFNGGPEIDTTDDYFHKGEYNSFTGESYSIGDINGDGFDDLIISRFD
ncbi:MAG: FG-GAP repeat protein, partial [Candidatus Delongbacteria bacterium]|nr:FG-GAP repeat protein [Candidatus Delongbacteria bacterium]